MTVRGASPSVCENEHVWNELQKAKQHTARLLHLLRPTSPSIVATAPWRRYWNVGYRPGHQTLQSDLDSTSFAVPRRGAKHRRLDRLDWSIFEVFSAHGVAACLRVVQISTTVTTDLLRLLIAVEDGTSMRFVALGSGFDGIRAAGKRTILRLVRPIASWQVPYSTAHYCYSKWLLSPNRQP